MFVWTMVCGLLQAVLLYPRWPPPPELRRPCRTLKVLPGRAGSARKGGVPSCGVLVVITREGR